MGQNKQKTKKGLKKFKEEDKKRKHNVYKIDLESVMKKTSKDFFDEDTPQNKEYMKLGKESVEHLLRGEAFLNGKWVKKEDWNLKDVFKDIGKKK